jgi:hypothetical protein
MRKRWLPVALILFVGGSANNSLYVVTCRRFKENVSAEERPETYIL